MPIYKVMAPQKVVSLKMKGYQTTEKTNHDTGAATVDVTDRGPQNYNKRENIDYNASERQEDAARGRDADDVTRQRSNEGKKGVGNNESIIEREIRELREREAELAATHGVSRKKKNQGDDRTDGIQNFDHRDDGFHNSNAENTRKTYIVEERRVELVNREPAQRPSDTVTLTVTRSTFDDDGNKERHGRGSTVILQELQEQIKREEELRRHRKEMGFEMENGETSVDVDIVDSGDVQMHRQVVDVKSDEQDQTKSGGMTRDEYYEDFQKTSGVTQKYSPRVQPFDDIDVIQAEVCGQYAPQNESPIEREIRLGREREEALWKARGIISAMVRPYENEVEVEVLKTRSVETGSVPQDRSNLDLTMKKFAESRLRSELEKEKKREIDMLKEGKIKLLSEQRMSDAGKYEVVISPETEELREFQKRKSVERSSVKHWNSLETGASVETRNGPQREESREETKKFGYSSKVPHNDAKDVTVVRVTRVRVSTESPNGIITEETRKISTTADAEQRIEEEVAETRRRERELRQERKNRNSASFDKDEEKPHPAEEILIISSSSPPLPSLPPPPPPAENFPEPKTEDHHHHHQQQSLKVSHTSSAPQDGVDGGSSHVWRTPGRLALIDQWERGLIQAGTAQGVYGT